MKMNKTVLVSLAIFAFVSAGICPSSIMAVHQDQGLILAQSDNPSGVPGVVIDYSQAESGKYIGCPSIAVLANGDYIASHSFFGQRTKNNRTGP